VTNDLPVIRSISVKARFAAIAVNPLGEMTRTLP
jgi:hypothetical protein